MAHQLFSIADFDPKAVALALHLNQHLTEKDGFLFTSNTPDDQEEADQLAADLKDEIQGYEDGADGNTYSEGSREYLILTDSEADNEEDDWLENDIDELILPHLPEQWQSYFDREAWKKDARQYGRGNTLASYDGHEHEETVDGETFYIYRTN